MSFLKDNKLLSRMFTRVGGIRWDLMSGKIGVQVDGGIATLSTDTIADPKDSTKTREVPRVSINPLDNFGMSIPAYATATPVANIAVGDIIIGANQVILGFAVGKSESNSQVHIMGQDGHVKTYNPPKVQILNIDGPLVVRNLFNLSGQSEGAFGNITGSALGMLALINDGNADEDIFDDVMPMILMSQMQSGGQANIGAMLPMLLMSKQGKNGGKGKIGMMEMMMLSGGLGGAGGAGSSPFSNPLMLMMLAGKNGGGLFGGDGDDTPPPLRAVGKHYR